MTGNKENILTPLDIKARSDTHKALMTLWRKVDTIKRYKGKHGLLTGRQVPTGSLKDLTEYTGIEKTKILRIRLKNSKPLLSEFMAIKQAMKEVDRELQRLRSNKKN